MRASVLGSSLKYDGGVGMGVDSAAVKSYESEILNKSSSHTQRLAKLNLFNAQSKQFRVEHVNKSRFNYLQFMHSNGNGNGNGNGGSGTHHFDDPSSTALSVEEMLSKERSLTDARGIKFVDKSLIMSAKERKMHNQNNIEDKLLDLTRLNLERQASYQQLQIKRERTMLLDQYLEAKATNYSYLRQMKLNEINRLNEAFGERLQLHAGGVGVGAKSAKSDRTQTDFNEKSSKASYLKWSGGDGGGGVGGGSGGGGDEATTNDYRTNSPATTTAFATQSAHPALETTPRPTVTIAEKFLEQKRLYYPSYKNKHNRIKRPLSDVDQIMERMRRVNERHLHVCTKFKDHRMAQHRAEFYNANKYLLKGRPELSVLMNSINAEIKAEQPMQFQAENNANVNHKNAASVPLSIRNH